MYPLRKVWQLVFLWIYFFDPFPIDFLCELFWQWHKNGHNKKLLSDIGIPFLLFPTCSCIVYGKGPSHSRKISQSSSKGINTKIRPTRGESASSGPDEEFFCLTPEDARSMASLGRSRNSSNTSLAPKHSLPVQIGVPDTKIFSVAVEARSAEKPSTDDLMICDIDTDYTGRFAVVSSCYSKPTGKSSIRSEKNVEIPRFKLTNVTVEDNNVEREISSETSTFSKIENEQDVDEKKGKKKKRKRKGGSLVPSVVNSLTEESKTAEDLQRAVSREVSPALEEDSFTPLVPTKCETTESLLAEALMTDETCYALNTASKETSLILLTDTSKNEEFSSKFVNNQSDQEGEQEKFAEDPYDEVEEAFIIREDSPTSDFEISESKDDKSVEDLPPEIDLETTGKPIDDKGFDASDVDGEGNDIINNIKLAERIYDDEDEKSDYENQKRHTKRLDSGIDTNSSHRQADNLDTSEDDLEFQPALSRKQRRKNKSSNNASRRASGASFADSESSRADDKSENEEIKASVGQEGWSFEADDLDINLLIAEVTNKRDSPPEEKISLEEVFKFDSEMASSNTEALPCKESSGKLNWNLNDLDQTQSDDSAPTNVNNFVNTITDESDVENNGVTIMSTSCNLKFDTGKKSVESGKDNKDVSLTQSLVCSTGLSETTSESSSVANSPNPRKTSKKSKKSKKKRF